MNCAQFTLRYQISLQFHCVFLSVQLYLTKIVKAIADYLNSTVVFSLNQVIILQVISWINLMLNQLNTFYYR